MLDNGRFRWKKATDAWRRPPTLISAEVQIEQSYTFNLPVLSTHVIVRHFTFCVQEFVVRVDTGF
jgi:hypothetical protein